MLNSLTGATKFLGRWLRAVQGDWSVVVGISTNFGKSSKQNPLVCC